MMSLWRYELDMVLLYVLLICSSSSERYLGTTAIQVRIMKTFIRQPKGSTMWSHLTDVYRAFLLTSSPGS